MRMVEKAAIVCAGEFSARCWALLRKSTAYLNINGTDTFATYKIDIELKPIHLILLGKSLILIRSNHRSFANNKLMRRNWMRKKLSSSKK